MLKFILWIFVFSAWKVSAVEPIPESNLRGVPFFVSTTQHESFGYRVSAAYEALPPIELVLGIGERIYSGSNNSLDTTRSALEFLYGVRSRIRFTEAFYLLTYAQNVTARIRKERFESIESGIAYGVGPKVGVFFELGLGVRYLWEGAAMIGETSVQQERWKIFPTLSVGRVF